MGKKKSSTGNLQQLSSSITLREESSGKKQCNVNAKSMLKLDHLKSLATWASAEAASMPSLGALFGHRLAAIAEALGVPAGPLLFSCQSCESILQPGYNCTVQIETIKTKGKQRCMKKPNVSTQNSVVYKCHLCLHHNIKRGIPEGYMKELCPPKAKLPSISDLTEVNGNKLAKAKVITACKDDAISKVDETASQCDPVNDSPTTPMTKVGTLLDTKKRKRNRSGSKKTVEPESSSVPADAEKASIASSKRKRKCWTSLKDIAERNEQNSSNFANLSIPFHI